MTELLTAQEVRKILRLGKNTIYDLARARKIEYVRVGSKLLFPKEAVEKFIRDHTVPASRNFFSMNGHRTRHYPGRGAVIEQPDEIAEKGNQDNSHSHPPDSSLRRA